MLLRSPFFIDNLGADQPYNSMHIIVPYCYNGCMGCQNAHLKEGELKEFTPEELAEEFKSNPFWEGVTLGGLEPHFCKPHWWKEFERFLELGEVEKLTIYTAMTEPLMHFSGVEEVYWKLGGYDRHGESYEVSVGDWKITLASKNQKFIKIT